MADEISIVVRAEDQFSNVLGNFGNIMTGIKSAIDLAGSALHTFGDFAMEGLQSIASYERMGAALTSLTASQILQTGAVTDMKTAMEMAAPQAEALQGWIEQLAIKSPFTSEGVAQAFRMAEAYGFSADESKRLVQALIDFSAGTGASEDSMRRITLALGQISATGKVTGGDMMQLVNAGLPVTQILADGFGVTTAKLMEMRSQGLLPATESIEYITEYLENNFKGAAEAQANTWAGLLGTFQDLKAIGLREFFGGLFDVLQPLAVSLSTWLQGPGMEMLSELGTKLGESTSAAVSALAPLADAFQTFFFWLDFGKTPLESFQIAMDHLSSADGPLGKVATLLFDIANQFASGGGGLVGAMGVFISDIISGIDWIGITNTIDSQLANAISGHNWHMSGDAFGVSIANALQGSIDSEGSTAVPAIAKAISDWFLGAAGVTSWTQFKDVFLGILNQFVLQPSIDWISQNWYKLFLPMLPSQSILQSIKDAYYNFVKGINDVLNGAIQGSTGIDLTGIAVSIFQGLQQGWNSAVTWLKAAFSISIQDIIDLVKDKLGISSPSTVFMQIGENIILGLIAGIFSLINVLGAVVGGVFKTIQDKFNTFLDKVKNIFQEISEAWDKFKLQGVIEWIIKHLFPGESADTTGTGTTTSTGSVGGQPGTQGTGTTTNSGVVNYNFYGPVYMSGVPAEGSYDCPPNPLISTSSNQLVANGY